MKVFQLLLLICFLQISYFSNAQDSIPVKKKTDKVTLGLGIGLEYGGLGGNLLYYPVENIGVFAGVGTALAGMGYNAGLKVRILSDSARVNLYTMAMYGYNASIYIPDAKTYNKLFYGVTFGLGLDTRYNPKKDGYWTFALLIPIRGSDVSAYMDDLEKNHNIKFSNGLFPVAITIGYRYLLF